VARMLDIYARVSRLGDDRQRSTGGQVEDCEARIEERGAQVGEVHVDSGRSAWNPRVKRPDWERLMSRLEAGATGGEWETSILLHTHPHLVRSTYSQNDHDAPHRPHLLITGIRAYAPRGIIGRPSVASAAKGQAALDSLTSSFSDVLKILTG
jgi:creatinine amidohydrolase/Fe(II)-dependent formamide hydrolase-like protein